MRRVLGPALATVLLSTGCTGSADDPSAGASASSPAPGAATTAPVPPAPEPAACYRLTSRQLTQPTNESRPVPCGGRHNAVTIFVGRLDTVVNGRPVPVDSDRAQRQVATACPRRLDAYLGGSAETRDLSRFNVVWYSPTLEQSDRGADWFRCDLIAFSRAEALQSLPRPGRLRGALARPRALDTWGLCGTAAPGVRGFERVICARRHSWRAVDTIPLAGAKRYPGVAVVRKAGDSRCRDLARARSGDALRFSYGWEWPTRAQWDRGQRFGYCWVPA
jgi:Septum formation